MGVLRGMRAAAWGKAHLAWEGASGLGRRVWPEHALNLRLSWPGLQTACGSAWHAAKVCLYVCEGGEQGAQ